MTSTLLLALIAGTLPGPAAARAPAPVGLGERLQCQGPADAEDNRRGGGGGGRTEDDRDRDRRNRNRDIERGLIEPDRPARVRVEDGRPPPGTEARRRYDMDAELGRNGPQGGGAVRDRTTHDRNRDIERGLIEPDRPQRPRMDDGRPPAGTEARRRYDRDAELGPRGASRVRDPEQEAIDAERRRQRRDAELGSPSGVK